MAYNKTNWVNGQAPAINAENLNKIEAGIEDAHNAIEGLEKYTLLWTNPAPGSQFAAQSINLDLSEYDKVEIVVDFSTGTQYGVAGAYKCDVGKNAFATGFYTGRMARRQIYTTLTAVSFDDAGYYNTYGSTAATVANQSLIPVEIYGIKIL